MKTENRRDFIKRSTMVSTGIAVGAPAYIRGYATRNPSDVINMASVGIRSQGRNHYRTFMRSKNARVIAVCDPDENLLPRAVTDIEEMGGAKPKTYIDVRDLLENKDIEAISIGAPDYWHALIAIWACQAGKDVYVEKPLSYTIAEGRKMVEAARKYNRIVQVGTQHRSNKVSKKAIQMLHEGVIGDIYFGRGTVYGYRGSIGRVADSPVPEGVNWDLYRGPAPMRPFNTNHFHYNWHWYWDTGTGEFGNNGVHSLDRIRLGMKKNVHPSKISCCGGFYAHDSDQEVPNLQIATFEYDDGAIMEVVVRSLPTPSEGGLLWLGTEGYAELTGSSFQTFMGPKKEPGVNITSEDIPDAESSDPEINPHYANFLDCIKSRNHNDLVADVLEGHMSTSMMLLGNIAYRTGRKLIFDGKTERFVNDKEADSYLTREYRKPYVLPEKV